jgi:hypothetical protein
LRLKHAADCYISEEQTNSLINLNMLYNNFLCINLLLNFIRIDWDILLLDMVELGFGDVLSLAQTFGIVGTLILTLYFSKRQIQSLSIDQQSRVLNDLDEKIHKTTELMLERPSLQRVVDNLGLTSSESEQYLFSYYILSIWSHAYAMRQRGVLNDAEWRGYI